MLRVRFTNGSTINYPTADYLETTSESWDLYETPEGGGARKWVASITLSCQCIVESIEDEEEKEKEEVKEITRSTIPFVH